jgi:FkbM family methyltransferase
MPTYPQEYPEIKTEVESGIYEQLYQLTEHDVVYDIGAHVGYFTALVAPRVKHVVAFEPEPRNFMSLTARCGSLRNVTLYNKAVMHSVGDVLLYRSTINSGGHSVNYPWIDGDIVSVRGTCLDLEVRVPAPTFLKIDCEGAEHHVLLGAARVLRNFKPHIAMEIHSPAVYTHVKRFLEALNYRLTPDPAPNASGWIAYATPGATL